MSKFSHIYIEKEAEHYPLTGEIIANFSAAKKIIIDDYSQVFNRSNQSFRFQKNHYNLILSVKKEGLIYNGSEECQDYANDNFYYNTPVLNCIYDCEYCFLQGKYSSANLVLFVNQDDFRQAARQAIDERPDIAKPLFLALSYDTDLLATENRIPVVRDWIEFARNEENILAEIRTKAIFQPLADLEPTDNILLSWTISPPAVCDAYERFAPGFTKRLKAAKLAQEAGWQVRICIDPIIKIDSWEELYSATIDKIFLELDAEKLFDLNLGFFRMNRTYYKRIRKMYPASPVYSIKAEPGDDPVTYREAERSQFAASLTKSVEKYLPADKIKLWD